MTQSFRKHCPDLRDPILIGKPLLHLGRREGPGMLRVPAPQILFSNIFPSIHDHYWQALIERVQGRAFDDDDVVEGQRLPRSVTVEPATARADDEGIARLLAPQRESRQLFLQEVNAGIPAQHRLHGCTRFATHRALMPVEVEVGVHARQTLCIRWHRRPHGLQLFLLLLRCGAPVAPPAPSADGVEIDANGEREHLATYFGGIEILREPANHVRVVEDQVSGREMGWHRPILIAADERKAHPNARQHLRDKLWQGGQPHPDQVPLAHLVVRVRVEGQG
jgi:hypothetical protein